MMPNHETLLNVDSLHFKNKAGSHAQQLVSMRVTQVSSSLLTTTNNTIPVAPEEKKTLKEHMSNLKKQMTELSEMKRIAKTRLESLTDEDLIQELLDEIDDLETKFAEKNISYLEFQLEEKRLKRKHDQERIRRKEQLGKLHAKQKELEKKLADTDTDPKFLESEPVPKSLAQIISMSNKDDGSRTTSPSNVNKNEKAMAKKPNTVKTGKVKFGLTKFDPNVFVKKMYNSIKAIDLSNDWYYHACANEEGRNEFKKFLKEAGCENFGKNQETDHFKVPIDDLVSFVRVINDSKLIIGHYTQAKFAKRLLEEEKTDLTAKEVWNFFSRFGLPTAPQFSHLTNLPEAHQLYFLYATDNIRKSLQKWPSGTLGYLEGLVKTGKFCFHDLHTGESLSPAEYKEWMYGK
jgi:hypothetical protein